jgi:hypothetical protein
MESERERKRGRIMIGVRICLILRGERMAESAADLFLS